MPNTTGDSEALESSATHTNLTEVVQIENVDDIQEPRRPTQPGEELLEEVMLNGGEGGSEIQEESHATLSLGRGIDHSLVDVQQIGQHRAPR